MSSRFHLLGTMGLLALGLTGVACDKKDQDAPKPPAPEVTADAGANAPDAATPKPDPHAALKGPRTNFVLNIVPTANSAAVLEDAKKVAAVLAKETGFTVSVNVPTSYKASVNSLRSNESQLAYFGSWEYMAGHMKADMEVLVTEVVDGNPSTKSQWVALQKSKLKKLEDLKGKKIAFSSPTSAAGFLFPAAQLLKENVIANTRDGDKVFKAMVVAQSEESALKGLSAGKWDAVAVSSTAPAKFLTPAETKGLVVLAEMGPVPTPSFSIKSTLPPETKEKFRAAFLKLSTPENKELLKKVFSMEELVKREHYQHADALQQAGDLAELEYPL